MEKIIKTYGQFILNVIIMLILLTYLFLNITDSEGNRGIMNVLGAHMQTRSIDYASYNDFDTYKTEAVKPAPEINYITSNQMHVGLNSISSYFSTVSPTGIRSFKVIDISDSFGNSVLAGYDATNQTISFPSAGIYTIRMQAVDEINKKKIVDVRVPVSAP